MKIKLLTIAFFIFLTSPFLMSQTLYYLGTGNGTEAQGTSCASCHKTGGIAQPEGVEGKFNEWKTTAHSTAQDSMKNTHFGYDCLQCHNTGWDPNTTNYGADEYVKKDTSKTPNYVITDTTKWNRVKNVGCESCHGPMGDKDGNLSTLHWPWVSGSVNKLNYSAELCAQCHQGAHHPYYDEWKTSLHAQSTSNAFVVKNKSCVKCHVAQNFIAYSEDPSAYRDTILVTGSDIQPITCQTCHDPHEKKYPGQLRFDLTSKSTICDQCHNAEIDSVDINTVPHHTTSEALSGSKNFGYQYPDSTYDNSAHTFAATKRCINCHLYMGPDAQGNTNTAHTFEPRVQACASCHKDYYAQVDTSNPATRFDYRGTQTKTNALIAQLQSILNNVSSADSQTVKFKEANYNLAAVEGEGSHGIHNTRLVQKLLRDAIASMNVTAVQDVQVLPNTYNLSQNYPNPFNPTTTIKFTLPLSTNVKVTIFNSIGQEIKTLVNSNMSAGSHQVQWNAISFPSGVYLYRIETKDFQMVKKMVLLK